MKNTILLLQKEHDRKRILELSMKNIMVLLQKEHDKQHNLELSIKNGRVYMSCSPLFYVGHASGTKNKWMIQMVKYFLCHDSVNKFDLKDSVKYVDNRINK